MTITTENGIISVEAPYNPHFVQAAKRLGGKWNPYDKVWEFNEAAINAVRDTLRKIYGEDDQEIVEKVNVRLVFCEEVSKCRNPVVVFGRVIASASGKDSGARVGDGVAFIHGCPTSGGSRNYWRTIVKEGSVVEIYNVPRDIIRESESYTFEIITEPKIDREALKAEKDRLLRRIAEIDAAINSEASAQPA